MTISFNLYEEVIVKYARNAKRLKILSGYASATFLERVIKQFPHLEIQLYIGMSKQGIPFKDHAKFKAVCNDSSKIRVFYQIYEPNNHMKIYRFEMYDGFYEFLGSANFSENGFLKQKEILTKITTNLQYLFDEQHDISLSCLDENIADYITFTEEVVENELKKGKKEKEIIRQNPSIAYETKGQNSYYIKNKAFVQTRYNITRFDKFDVLIVQDAANNPHWATSTINARFDERETYIRQNNKWSFQEIFPLTQNSEIYFEEMFIVGYLGGSFNSHLYFKGFDLYEYLYIKLSLKEKRAISYEELAHNGLERLYFTRLNENMYLMSFENNN